jgi:hypothetical protein
MLNKAPSPWWRQFGDARDGGSNARGEQYARLKEILEDARPTRGGARISIARRRARSRARRADLEALIPVVEGRLPLMVNVDQASDIDAIMRLANEQNVKLIVVAGRESWKVAARLAPRAYRWSWGR